MVNPSNLYAEKIFSEHPVAMWSFDDSIKYLSLITDAQRSLTAWTFTSAATGTNYTTQPPYPKLGTTVTNVTKTSVTSSGTFTATSNYTVTPNADTFAVGFYYYKLTPYITSVRIGYKEGASATVWSSSITTSEFYSWGFASNVFSATVTNANIVIEFTYAAPTSSDTVSILINGLTVGNFAEDSHTENVGSQLTALPSSLGISASFTEGIEISRYNSSSDKGYIIAKDDAIYARNTSFPMTFGSENVLVLYPNETDSPDPAPSLVLPGKGFLNEVEKYKTKTFEAWIRVKAQTTTPKRIIGPITGTDGLYVNGPYLMLSVGDNFGSYYVGEWDRPMLIQMVTSTNSAKLFINGDLVISLSYDIEDITFAEYYEVAPATYDWIGFYCYSDVPRLEVDCVAIYAYEVDKVLALRRFVYGQGIDFPTNMISRNGGETAFPDYSTSQYANNFTYGEGQRFSFSDGDKTDNLNVVNKRISYPRLRLPEVRLEPGSTFTTTDLFSEQAVSDYLDLQPSAGWNDTESHLYFDKISQLSEKTKAIYIIATRSENNASKQILFKIFDKISGNFLEAYTITSGGNNNIVYSFSYNGATATLATVSGNVIGTKFGAGIDIENLISLNTTNGTNLRDFFSSQERLALYIGGDEEFTTDTTFTGKLYKFGFANSRNLSKISSLFTNGIFSGSATTLNSHVASYTLIVNNFAGNVFLDIATNMYWQESIPMTSLAKFSSGDYLLDYLQINLDYPRPITFSSSEYNTDNSEARLYLTFQDVTNTPSDALDFATSVRVDSSNVIEDTTGYATTKYEMVDGTVIYIPSGIDKESYFVVVHLEVNVNGISTNPIDIRNIQVASQAHTLNTSSVLEIPTKNNVSLIAYNNAIVNPPFELNTTGWGVRNGSVTRSSAMSYEGTYSALFTVGSSGQTAGINVSPTTTYMPAVTPGDTVTYSIYVKDVDTAESYRSFIDFYDATPTFITGSGVSGAITSVSTSAWTRVSVTATVPAGAAYARPYTYSSTIADAGKTVHFDSATFHKGYITGQGNNNPVIIPKDNDPHLYLSANSGMSIAGEIAAKRGFYLPLNSGESTEFDVAIIQATMKFQIEEFSTSDVLVFELEKEDMTTIKFYIDSLNTGQNRAKLFAKDQTGATYTNLEYYINGIKTEYPAISLDEWVTIGIRITEHFSFSGQTGRLKISGPMLLNNISYFQLKAGDEASSIVTAAKWADILYREQLVTITAVNDAYPSSGTVEYTASNSFSIGDVVTISGFSIAGFNGTFTITAATSTYFRVSNSTTGTPTLTNAQAQESRTLKTWAAYDTETTWETALAITASATEINGLEIDDVYKSFAGTNKIIAAYDATDRKLKTKSYSYPIYIGSSSNTITSSPL